MSPFEKFLLIIAPAIVEGFISIIKGSTPEEAAMASSERLADTLAQKKFPNYTAEAESEKVHP